MGGQEVGTIWGHGASTAFRKSIKTVKLIFVARETEVSMNLQKIETELLRGSKLNDSQCSNFFSQ